MPIHLKLILFFFMGFVLTYVLTNGVMGFAKTLGIRNNNDIIVRWASTTKPSLGGIPMFVTMVGLVIVFLVLNPFTNVFSDPHFLYFFLAFCMAFCMGLADDAYNTKPFVKLFTQICCGLALVFSNLIIPFSGQFGVDAVITLFWVVGIMNSINMLDNMDGITATTSTVSLIFILTSTVLISQFQFDIWAFLIVGFIGSLLAFLLFNAPPSRLFMGDSGSQMIGFLLAFLSIKYLWNLGTTEGFYPLWVRTFLVILMLCVPFIDTLTVVINRIRRGQSPAVGGKDHTTHHMVYAGYSEKKVWILTGLMSIAMCGFGLLLVTLYDAGFGLYAGLAFTPFYIVFYFLFGNTQKFSPPAHEKNKNLDQPISADPGSM
jgi:UDP-GlcNAc:undecaprenyl-phosphate GlcNAc-1-phosphate transferase